jgi:hypothetical protein
VFQRLGPMPPQDKQAKSSRGENFEEEEDKYHRPRWCPDGLSHSQKRRVQWLRTLEEAEAQYLEILRKAHLDLAVKVHCTQKKELHPRKREWRPSQQKAMGRHRQEQTWCSFSLQNSMHQTARSCQWLSLTLGRGQSFLRSPGRRIISI